METKICKSCDTEKELIEFSKNRYRKDGVNSYCKPCIRVYQNGLYAKKKYKKLGLWGKIIWWAELGLERLSKKGDR